MDTSTKVMLGIGAVAAATVALASAAAVFAYVKRDELTLPACRWMQDRFQRLTELRSGDGSVGDVPADAAVA